MAQLGVNIDHIATVREARQTTEPDPVWAAVLAELGGADGITVHPREDQRHIQPHDVRRLKDTVAVKLNMEMACAESVLELALELKPEQATLVPERREEVTTEGGLDAAGQRDLVKRTIEPLKEAGIVVNLFLDPDAKQIEAAADLGADGVELHTGQYALAWAEYRAGGKVVEGQIAALADAGALVRKLNMTLLAGHGLTYNNVQPIAQIKGMTELNIGHSIISRALMTGMERAVREMKALIV